jgi:two-component system chemotaxis sensor kinase CheA
MDQQANGGGAGSFARDPDTLEVIGDFLVEAEDGLSRADELLLELERDGFDAERVNALFRVFHTIKGVAGFVDLRDVATLAHSTEAVLDALRSGLVELSQGHLDVTFEATASMRRMLADVRRAVETHSDLEGIPELPGLLERLAACLKAADHPLEPARVELPAPDEAAAPAAPTPLATLAAFADAPDSEPIDDASIPAAVAAYPIIPKAPAPPSGTDVAPLEKLERADRGERDEVAEEAPAQAAAVAPKGQGPQAGEGTGTRLKETLKVDVERVDSVVELIGELIIVESMIVHAPEINGIGSLKIKNSLNQLTKISRDLQDLAMRMRMLPMRGVLQKLARLVRELSRKTQKEIAFQIVGETTEIDRCMAEQIADPLMHMIRNAIDHGIELPEDRVAAGKAREATVRIAASHEGGNVVIEVSDDGRGLSREKILRKAIEKGLVRDGDALTDGEVFALIFEPGFSTAAVVTDISGRGVGMDVVKRNVEAMRGRVLVSSVAGRGTTFRIVLPLTLAVIDGMLVACGDESYIVPSLSIVESLRPKPEMLSSLRGRDEFLDVRGELVPLYRLARLFEVASAQSDPTQGLVVVVESLGKKIGLLVDDVVSQQQVVIKPLGANVQHADVFSGAAILSDGRVGLILNVDRIGSMVGRARGSVQMQEVFA